ncbi:MULTISPECIES: helix-turn-helix domain-containing protein [Rhizobium]|uniref:helix-turn-helix domain-containing protein n=1 Tax=Rhizobium TaxID=379 RepID=UPI001B31CDC8|nr:MULTISPECIES: helix-turn-helix domain-containing protein [Rhizobium]MBX4910011.1 helix-turn-helix domain-containing protein [Rhizobium bangladeshense]MBX5218057.1 helix-turn-helix domain-containing protein [Rhizobium sp. NLR9a]MBX5235646.1 helix-turn-helix domain-containing protein [Rhizobium sp. NLR4a]MBX5241191.1 helix-turn-helix domain-containing protein [Rhizobium sp. NLR22b]MBX5247948.1 helix-turn-helix domain-containing protein [Rhizobium sp. NLR3b]
MNVKTPNAIDSYVGARIRTRRQLLGMSQERLAEQIGVTFQQVQKYEKGINRIGASRLQRIAEVLHTSPSFFFQQNESQPLSLQGLDLPDRADPVAEFLRTKEGLVLNRAFLKIADPDIRETIIALVKAMAQAESRPALPSIANITRPPLE